MSGVLAEVPGQQETGLPGTYDDLPLWAAPFGLGLLAAVGMRAGMSVLDVGSGTGFPLLELAQRLGNTSRVFGVDPWRLANLRALEKARAHGITNAHIVEAKAESLPFPDRSFDLIVSNNGINNVGDPDAALRECGRVARSGGQMVFTMNLPETMKEFYYVFADTLEDLGLGSRIGRLHEHILEQRLPVSLVRKKVEAAGFQIDSTVESAFRMRFATGTALLNHSFIRRFFRGRWEEIVTGKEREKVFGRLELCLNVYAERCGSMDLTVPYVRFDCHRS